jgi:hypothetical protein
MWRSLSRSMLKVKRSCTSGSPVQGLPRLRHFSPIDKSELHGASFCMKHLLLPSVRDQTPGLQGAQSVLSG